MRFNKVEIDGNNNIVIQNSDGSTTTQMFDIFLQTFTFEKDEKIKLLEKNLSDKEKLQNYSEREIETLKIDLEKSIFEKAIIEKKIDDLLNQFKNKDLLETNELFQNALTLFLGGDIQGAILSLSEDTLEKDLIEIHEEEATIKKKKQQVADSYILKGHLLSLENSFEEAQSKFIKATIIYPSFPIYIETGNFYGLFDKLEIAKEYYEKGLEVASSVEEKAIAFYWLGKTEMLQHSLEKAYEYLNKSLQIKDISTYDGSENSQSFLADLYTSLAQQFQATNQYELSKEKYHRSLEIRKRLVKINEKRYLPDLARSLNSLAIFYRLSGEFSLAKPYFFEALGIYEYLLSTSSIFLLNYTNTLSDTGLLFKQEFLYDDARYFYEKSTRISREALITNRWYFVQPLAYSLNILGTMNAAKGLWDEAEENLKEALVLRRELALTSPKSNLVVVAEVLINLGVLYQKTHRLELAKQSLTEALQIYEGYSVVRNSETQSNIAKTKHNFANLLFLMNEPENAERFILESLQIRRTLSAINPKSHNLSLASSLNSYGNILKTLGKLDLAEEAFLESFQIHKSLLVSKMIRDYYSFAKSSISLAKFYHDSIPNKEKSISLISEAVSMTYLLPAMDDEMSFAMDLAVQIINSWGMSWDEFILSIKTKI